MMQPIVAAAARALAIIMMTTARLTLTHSMKTTHGGEETPDAAEWQQPPLPVDAREAGPVSTAPARALLMERKAAIHLLPPVVDFAAMADTEAAAGITVQPVVCAMQTP